MLSFVGVDRKTNFSCRVIEAVCSFLQVGSVVTEEGDVIGECEERKTHFRGASTLTSAQSIPSELGISEDRIQNDENEGSQCVSLQDA